MKRFVVLRSTLLAFTLIASAVLLGQGVARDLGRYDNGGTLVIDHTRSVQTFPNAKLRKFLWNHWRKRVLGRIVVTGVTTEGQPNTTSYFIEPDEMHVWNIAVQLEAEDYDSLAEKSEHRSVRYQAYTVTRVEVPRDETSLRIPISDKRPRSSNSYRLLLKDHTGQVLAEL